MSPSNNKHGNKGHFHGAPLDFLQEHAPRYISTATNAKEVFWTSFFPAWDEKYLTLHSAEQEELVEEEANYKAEIKRVKEQNSAAVRKHGRAKAVVQPHPASSERLNELRARGAKRVVCS
jgi:hypothetical protein